MRSALFLPIRGLLLAALGSSLAFAEPSLKLTPVNPPNPSGIYKPGDKIVWKAEILNDDAHAVHNLTYFVKQGGEKVLAKGELPTDGSPAFVETKLDEPGTLLAGLNAKAEGEKGIWITNGATVLPGKLTPSAQTPADFEAFWKAKLAELAAVPENAVLEKGDSGRPGVDYWKITMGNIRGTHVYGQVARPAQGDKFPAMLIVNGAGVYPLAKDPVLNAASQGWLALNITAHDLPIDEPKAFYDDLLKGEFKDYTTIGNTDRETSYFLRMYLACYRAVEYLSKRPDWNGKILLATGGSQGGLQSIVAAAMHPKVTHVIIEVPAGCDTTGALSGRNPGWPYWKRHADVPGADSAKIMETSRYYDAVNFASRIHVPVLVGMGLSDPTSPASGVFTAINQMQGPKEVLIFPDGTHQNTRLTLGRYYQRANDWRVALAKGEPAPLQPNAEFDATAK